MSGRLGLPPRSESELLARAEQLASCSLSELADRLGRRLPLDTARDKGFVGQLVEDALGATAENRPRPDFEALGVELKTVPVQAEQPKESTFIGSASVRDLLASSWDESGLRAKTRKILWIPVEADPELPLGTRRLGAPLPWAPSVEDDARMRADWEVITAMARRDAWDALDATVGEVVQLRPKGRDGRSRTALPGGGHTMPRAFYFRRRFIRALFRNHFATPA